MRIGSTTLPREFKAAKAALNRLRAVSKTRPAVGVATELREDVFRYIRLLQRERWDALDTYARRRGATLAAHLKRDRRRLQVIAEVTDVLRRAEQRIPELPLGRDPRFASALPEIRQRLKEKGVTGAAQSRAIERIRNLNASTVDLQRPARMVSEHALRAARDRLAMSMGNTLAGAVASFNRRSATGDRRGRVPDRPTLTKAERAVRQALRGTSLSAIRLAAGRAEAAGLRVLAVALSASGAPDGLALADTTRRALNLIAVGRLVALESAAGLANPVLEQWQAAARRPDRPAAGSIPKMSVAMLAGTTRAIAAVRVQGVLEDLKIVHRGRKVISTASLVAGRNRVAVVLPYIKLDSGGIVDGATVEMVGSWSPRDPETQGPALALRRLQLAKAEKHDWRAFVARAVRHVWQGVPHGLDVRWSWVAGKEGPGNQLKYATWFAKWEDK